MNKQQLKRKRLKLVHSGKVNNVYQTDDPLYLELEASDRTSAGNGKKTDIITNKGIINNMISSMLFNILEAKGIPTHYVGEGSNQASKFVKTCRMIPLEVTGIFVTTGSICRRYGIPKGISFSPAPFIEFFYKSDEEGDSPIDRRTITTFDILTIDELHKVEAYASKIGQSLSEFYNLIDVELIDFRVEFGRSKKNGELLLAGDISPDTCQLIDTRTGKSLEYSQLSKKLDLNLN